MFAHRNLLKTSFTLVLCTVALVLAGTSQTVAAPGEPEAFPSSAAAQDRGTRFLRQPDVRAAASFSCTRTTFGGWAATAVRPGA